MVTPVNYDNIQVLHTFALNFNLSYFNLFNIFKLDEGCFFEGGQIQLDILNETPWEAKGWS